MMREYINIISSEMLEEAVDRAPIYHSTALGSALAIIKSNHITSNRYNRTVINDVWVSSVSFTRSLVFAVRFNQCILELDQKKVKHDYGKLLVPYVDRHGQIDSIDGDIAYARKEAEECLIGDLLNLDKYLTGIYVKKEVVENMQKFKKHHHELEISFQDRYEEISKHPLYKGLVNKIGKICK